jgi:hypothetical protein
VNVLTLYDPHQPNLATGAVDGMDGIGTTIAAYTGDFSCRQVPLGDEPPPYPFGQSFAGEDSASCPSVT